MCSIPPGSAAILPRPYHPCFPVGQFQIVKAARLARRRETANCRRRRANLGRAIGRHSRCPQCRTPRCPRRRPLVGPRAIAPHVHISAAESSPPAVPVLPNPLHTQSPSTRVRRWATSKDNEPPTRQPGNRRAEPAAQHHEHPSPNQGCARRPAAARRDELRCLRRVGPAALRAGIGLRRPGLPALDRAAPGCPAASLARRTPQAAGPRLCDAKPLATPDGHRRALRAQWHRVAT
jgi:hypothetical protein